MKEALPNENHTNAEATQGGALRSSSLASTRDFVPRANVLGVGVSALNMQEAVRLCDEHLRSGARGYICVTGVHGVTEAQDDPEFRKIQNASFLTVPDGMPMVWVGRLQGFHGMRRVYGPDFMKELCEFSVKRGYKHFLYGGKPGVAENLKTVLTGQYPGLQIVGCYSPPFRALNSEEESQLIADIESLSPDVIWVGLSTPKQERFMANYQDKLRARLFVGVGAAFDIHTGAIKDAPGWMKNSGLQWLHRLVQEPKRLWRRYLLNNPRFAWKVLLQFLGVLRFEIEG